MSSSEDSTSDEGGRASGTRGRKDDEDIDMEEELDDGVARELLGGDDDGDGSSSDSTGEGSDVPLEYDYEYNPAELVDDERTLSSEQRERMAKIERAAADVRRVIERYGNAPLPPLDPNDDANRHEWKIDEDSAWSDPSAAMEEIVNAGEELTKAWGDGDGAVDGAEGKKNNQKEEWWKPIIDGESSKKDAATDASEQRLRDRATSPPLTDEELGQFQSVHLEWATEAFAEELDALRTGRLEELVCAKKKKKNEPEAGLDPAQFSLVATPKKSGGSGGEGGSAPEEADVQVLADILRSGGEFLSNTEKRMLLNARQRATKAKDPDERKDELSLHERRRRELGFKLSIN